MSRHRDKEGISNVLTWVTASAPTLIARKRSTTRNTAAHVMAVLPSARLCPLHLSRAIANAAAMQIAPISNLRFAPQSLRIRSAALDYPYAPDGLN